MQAPSNYRCWSDEYYCLILLTAFHRHLAELLVVRIFVKVHGAGEEQSQPEDKIFFLYFIKNILDIYNINYITSNYTILQCPLSVNQLSYSWYKRPLYLLFIYILIQFDWLALNWRKCLLTMYDWCFCRGVRFAKKPPETRRLILLSILHGSSLSRILT